MNEIATTAITGHRITRTSAQGLANASALEAAMRGLPQLEAETHHVIHAGIYTRTIMMPAGAVLVGVEIKIGTVLIVSGDITLTVDNKVQRLSGYHVLPASAGRKQVCAAHADTWLTMIFSTDATNIDAAEQEFTHEAEKLLSRSMRNSVLITGESKCLEQHQ